MITESDLYALEQRVHKLEEKIEKLAGVGDMIEVEQHRYGDVYERKNYVIKDITKG